MAVEEEEEAERSLGAYWRLLRDYPGWRILWIGEILSNIGNWFNYVATLLVVEQLAEGKGIYLSIVLVIHFLPSFVLFPIAGVLADRYDRLKIIIYSGLVSAGAVLLLPLVKHPSQLWLLYMLLIVSFSTTAFYDPARRALAPSLVPRKALHLATTLDSFAWSLTGAFGSSLGGLAASKIGTQACFYLDSVTYLVAALCAYRLKRLQLSGSILASKSTELTENPGSKQSGGALPSSIPPKIESEIPSSAKALTRQPMDLQGDLLESQSRRSVELGQRGLGSAEAEEDEEHGESMALLDRTQDEEHLGGGKENRGPAPEGFIPLILWGMRDEFQALKEGWQYACSSSNRDVLGYTMLKASGTLVWGAGDILSVRFSELPEMQGLGDSAFTLGLLFASVGLACFIGPVFFNCVTPPKPPHLMLSSALCFVFLFSGYCGLAASPEVVTTCLSTMLRSFGSSVLWVYSTLLLQLRVPDGLLGRMLALEVAFFTIGESVSVLLAGFALDDWGVTIRQLCLILAGVGALMSFAWLPFAIRNFARHKRADKPSADI